MICVSRGHILMWFLCGKGSMNPLRWVLLDRAPMLAHVMAANTFKYRINQVHLFLSVSLFFFFFECFVCIFASYHTLRYGAAERFQVPFASSWCEWLGLVWRCVLWWPVQGHTSDLWTNNLQAPEAAASDRKWAHIFQQTWAKEMVQQMSAASASLRLFVVKVLSGGLCLFLHMWGSGFWMCRRLTASLCS